MEIILKKESISQGVNFLNKDNLIIYFDGKNYTAIENRCKHEGGKFYKREGSQCSLKCKNHGWKLNLESLKYENSVGVQHDRLKVVINKNQIIVKKKNNNLFSGLSKKEIPKDLYLNFISHATLEIVCGKYNIITDPWCTGPAFVNGWWLENKPPRDWRKRIAFSNLIYISMSSRSFKYTYFKRG